MQEEIRSLDAQLEENFPLPLKFDEPVNSIDNDLNKLDKYFVENIDVISESSKYIDEFDKFCEQEGAGYEAPSYPIWSQKMEGLQNGFYIFAGYSNSGKALRLSTPVLKTNGEWTTIKDIKIGDSVWGDDGLPTNVRSKSEIFTNHDCYKITFDDRTEIIADADHLWKIIDKSQGHKNRKEKVLKTSEIAKKYYWIGSDGYKKLWYAVPMQKPLKCSEKKLPIPPYVLGYWLGNGNKRDNKLTIHEDDYENVKATFESFGWTLSDSRRDSTKPETKAVYTRIISDVNKNDSLSIFRKNNLLFNKHIPRIYLTSSIQQRKELLAGLMDADGSVNGGLCEFTQATHQKICNDFTELLCSLGIKNTKSHKNIILNGKKFEAYRWFFAISKNNSCFFLERKTNLLRNKLSPRSYLYKTIKEVEKIESEPTQCIGVDNESHCFCVGEKLTVTHNTAIASNIALDYALNLNNKLYMIYYALDDTKEDVMSRMVSMKARIPISVVRKPGRYRKPIEEGHPNSKKYQALLDKRLEGIKTIKEMSKNFMVKDSEEIDCIERMLNHAKMVKENLQKIDPENNIIVVIDSLMDINIDSKNFKEEKDRNTAISQLVKRYSTVDLKCPIFGTAHVRKNSGNRIKVSDLKESGRYEYDAKVVFLITNDVSRNGQGADIYYRAPGDEVRKHPVLEIHWAKNKVSSFKERTYCYFVPEYSLATECSQAQMESFDSIIYDI